MGKNIMKMTDQQKRTVEAMRQRIEKYIQERNEKTSPDFKGQYCLTKFEVEPLGDVKNHIVVYAQTTLKNLGDYNEVSCEKRVQVFVGKKGGVKGKAYRFNARGRNIRGISDAVISLYQ